MKLENHIARRFLTDDALIGELLELMHPKYDKDDIPHEVMSTYNCISTDGNKSYYLTKPVIDNFKLLKTKKSFTEGIGEHFDWTVFKDLPDCKATFIFPENYLVRMTLAHKVLHFCHISFKFKEGSKNFGEMYSIMFFIRLDTGELCSHMAHPDVKRVEDEIYRMLCFMYLTDNDEILLAPGAKHGTKKAGKLINTLSVPITMVNSRWHTTTVRSKGFDVSGHFRLQPYPTKGTTELIYIQPFTKEGYTRKAGALLEKQ